MRPGFARSGIALTFALLASCRSPQAALSPEEALVKAAKAGDLATTQRLIERHVDVKYCPPRGSTALLEASAYGHPKIVRALLAAGAPVDQVNSAGHTALMAAATNGQLEVMRILLTAGADVNSEGATVPGELGTRYGPTTALLMTLSSCHTAVIQELLAKGAKVQYHGDHGRLALRSALQLGCDDLGPILRAALDQELERGGPAKPGRQRSSTGQATADGLR